VYQPGRVSSSGVIAMMLQTLHWTYGYADRAVGGSEASVLSTGHVNKGPPVSVMQGLVNAEAAHDFPAATSSQPKVGTNLQPGHGTAAVVELTVLVSVTVFVVGEIELVEDALVVWVREPPDVVVLTCVWLVITVAVLVTDVDVRVLVPVDANVVLMKAVALETVVFEPEVVETRVGDPVVLDCVVLEPVEDDRVVEVLVGVAFAEVFDVVEAVEEVRIADIDVVLTDSVVTVIKVTVDDWVVLVPVVIVTELRVELSEAVADVTTVAVDVVHSITSICPAITFSAVGHVLLMRVPVVKVYVLAVMLLVVSEVLEEPVPEVDVEDAVAEDAVRLELPVVVTLAEVLLPLLAVLGVTELAEVTEEAEVSVVELSVEVSINRRRHSALPRSGGTAAPPPQAQHASLAGGVAPATLDAKLPLASVQPGPRPPLGVQRRPRE